jgi:hypothetical protein
LEDAVKQLAGHEVKTTQRHGSVVETLDEFEQGADWSSSASAASTPISPRAISAAIWNGWSAARASR